MGVGGGKWWWENGDNCIRTLIQNDKKRNIPLGILLGKMFVCVYMYKLDASI